MKKNNSIEKRMLVKIAKMYYFDELTQQQIANYFNISRSSVSRALTQAKQQGIVHIYIDDEYSEEQLVEKRLHDQYGIREACVVNVNSSNKEELNKQVGGVMTRIMAGLLNDDDTIGLMAGSTVNSVCENVGMVNRKGLKIVPMAGGMGVKSAPWQVNQATMALSEKWNADYYVLNSPSYVSSEKAREIIVNEPGIKTVLDLMKSCNVAIVGIGEMEDGASLYRLGGISHQDIEKLIKNNTAASLGAAFIDEDGKIIDTDVSKRMICVTPEELKQIPTVIAVAYGKNKVKAIEAVLKSGLIDILITDLQTANMIA